MPEYGFSLIRSFLDKDRVYDSVLIRENKVLRKLVFRHILLRITYCRSLNPLLMMFNFLLWSQKTEHVANYKDNVPLKRCVFK